MQIEVIKNKIIRIPIENWNILGTTLYGKNRSEWKFICPNCGRIQTVSEFEKYFDGNKEEAFIKAMYHCISRYSRENEGKCSWTLNGIFKIHKLELKVMHEISPTFEFADALITDDEIMMIQACKDGKIFEPGENEDESVKIWAAFAKEGLKF